MHDASFLIHVYFPVLWILHEFHITNHSFGQNQLWPSIQIPKNSNHLDLLINALKMRTSIPWDAWQAPSHAGYLQVWTVRKQNLTGICSHMAGTSLQTCPCGFRSLENYLPNSICFCSDQAKQFYWHVYFSLDTKRHIIIHNWWPTMAWPLHPMMDMCHLAMGCSSQAKQFCWCVYSSLDMRRHIITCY